MNVKRLSENQIELLSLLAEAEEDVINGRVAPIQDTFDNIRKLLLEGNLYEI